MANTKGTPRELAARVAELDRELCLRIAQRIQLARELWSTEKGSNESDALERNPARWMDEVLAAAPQGAPEDTLRSIFAELGAASSTSISPTKAAYLGSEGTFCHQAAREYFGATAQLLERSSAFEVLEEVQRERAEYGVLRLESSSDGVLQRNVLALAQTPLVMVGQREIQARYELVSRAAALEAVGVVYVTPPAYVACEGFIHRELAPRRVEYVRSVGAALERVIANSEGAALLPDAALRESPGRNAALVCLRSNVADLSDVRLRFAIVGWRPPVRSGQDLTCALLGISDRPGALMEVLKYFAERSVNLRRVQACPVQVEAYDYLFYVELEGHVTDRSVVMALESVKRGVRYLRVLGSFPVG